MLRTMVIGALAATLASSGVGFQASGGMWSDDPPPPPCNQMEFDCQSTRAQVPVIVLSGPGAGIDPCGSPCALPSACWWNLIGAPVGSVGNHLTQTSCTRVVPSSAGARAWQDKVAAGECVPDQTAPVPAGFRMNYSMYSAPSPGDFLPPVGTIGEDALCLMPDGAAQETTEWNGQRRPTLDGVVDLVTGVPLFKTVDLELPLDGAKFRLMRTRSGSHDSQLGLPPKCVLNPRIAGPDRWWDWAGTGWMVGENPLLLIDSALADVVGGGPRTCWLILDAHRSIPFQQIESTGQYEAPPRFRARLTAVGGSWDAVCRRWEVFPTQYVASLYDSTVKYTFEVRREDIPPNCWDSDYVIGGGGDVPMPECGGADIMEPIVAGSPCNESRPFATLHSRPVLPKPAGPDVPQRLSLHSPWDSRTNPGFGVPYFGLCTRIEDRNGTVVEITYRAGVRQSMDLAETAGCVECAQDCVGKGEIDHIRVLQNGVVKWTLAYVHRRVRDWVPPGPGAPGGSASAPAWVQCVIDANPQLSYLWDYFAHSAIDRIYVFEGNRAFDGPMPLVHWDDRPADLTRSPVEWFDVDPAGIDESGRFAGFRYRVRYDYRREGMLSGPPQGEVPAEYALVTSPPLLIKTTVVEREAESGEKVVIGSKAFAYGGGREALAIREDGDSRITWLRAVITDADLGRQAEASAAAMTMEQLALDVQSMSETDPALLHLAGVQVEPTLMQGADLTPQWSASGDAFTPDPVALIAQVNPSVAAGRLRNDSNTGTVGTVSVRVGNQMRHYRVMRLAAYPREVWSAPFEPMFSTYDDLDAFRVPRRSAFSHPFLWHPHVQGGCLGGECQSNPDDTQPPDLSEARWISIIDEFESRQAMLDGDLDPTNPKFVYRGGHATKPGQVSRRVVEVNASGIVLREKVWQFAPGPDGPVVTQAGQGLGEENVYRPVNQLFTDFDATYPIPAPSTGEPDPYAGIRRELLLVEKRTVGWSAVPAAERTGNGLVAFSEYALVAPTPQPDVVGQPAVVVKAEGIRRGTGFPDPGSPGNPSTESRLTRQVFMDPDDPTSPRAEVRFVSEVSQPLEAEPDFADPRLLVSPASMTVTWFRVTRAEEPGDTRPVNERPVVRRVVVGSPRQLRPGSGWYYPVEREDYSIEGAMDWSAQALVLGSNLSAAVDGEGGWTPDPLESVSFTYYERDGQGRAANTVLDAQPGTLAMGQNRSFSFQVAVPEHPSPAWARNPAQGGLNYLTHFEYDVFGLSEMFLPGNRRWARRIVILDRDNDLETKNDKYAKEFVFNDLVYDNGVNGVGAQFKTTSAGEVKIYGGRSPTGAPQRVLKVQYPDGVVNIDSPPEGMSQWPHTPLQETRYGFDSNGRVEKADLIEYSADGSFQAVGSKEVNDLGEVVRERDPDGTVMRRTRSAIGQHLRTYVGTDDYHWLAPEDGSPRTRYNMILTERIEYGNGPNDAWQPTANRRYTHNPEWAHDHHGVNEPPPTSDVDGIATVTRYDWRMRPVRVDSFEQGDPFASENGPPRISTTLTYLDHANRPRLMVTYGRQMPVLPVELDPANLVGFENVPEARAFYALAAQDPRLKPTSIVESVYAPDGGVAEQRVYDMAWAVVGGSAEDPPYQATLQYYGRGGTEVFSQIPGRGPQVTVLDGTGRIASTIAVLPRDGVDADARYKYQLSRTDNTYDADGNVVEAARWERVRPEGDVLDLTNAVRSRTVNWYDFQKRLIASADLGTEQDRYIAGPSTYQRTEGSTPRLVVSAPAVGQTRTATIERAGVPAGAMLRLFHFDELGQQDFTAEPAGSITAYEYDRAGRMIAKIENWRFVPVEGTPAAEVLADAPARRTEYAYELGRLVAMRSKRTTSPSESPQETRVRYFTSATPVINLDLPLDISPADQQLLGLGSIPVQAVTPQPEQTIGAEVVDDQFNVVSRNGGLPQGLIMPGAGDLSIRLRYNFLGQVAERIDARGVAFRYRYDDAGRLARVEVGAYGAPPDIGSNSQFTLGYPSWLTPNMGKPADRISSVEYSYDDHGRLAGVLARDDGGAVVAHDQYQFDARGQLEWERQAIGQVVDPATSKQVSYAWDYQSTDSTVATQIGRSRLVGMTYPIRPGMLAARQVQFGYGDAGSADDVVSRIARIGTNTLAVPVADYAYTGGGRRATESFAGGRIVADLRSSSTSAVGLHNLDAFGRLVDLNYLNSTAADLFRGEYRYDISGNRIAAKIVQAPHGQATGVNERSQVNRYDQLNRLIGADVGVLEDTGTTLQISAAGRVRTDQWKLDLLGNWVGGAAAGTTGPPEFPGRVSEGNLDAFGTPWALGGATPGDDYRSSTHTVDHRNRLMDRFETGIVPAPGSGGTPAVNTDKAGYDRSGNLTFDGTYFYQYDAWGRLVQVNKATRNLAVTPPFDHDSYDGITPPHVVIGAMVKHYTYDGLGRLVRTQSPYPSPDSQAGYVRVERFIYDGARRVQELVLDPVLNVGAGQEDENFDVQNAANTALNSNGDPNSGTLPLELAQQNVSSWVTREYIWGPGDGWSAGGAGIDELLVQFDGGVNGGKPTWILTDAGGDCVAACDLAGASPVIDPTNPPPTLPDPGTGQVAAQFVYDAYGELLAADHLRPHAYVRCGHKGLFFDRLDIGVLVSTGTGQVQTYGEPPRLVPFGHLIGHNRNRAYSPGLGRFMQADPNAQAGVLMEALSHQGLPLAAAVAGFDLMSMYGDGGSLYAYLGSNPYGRSDAAGLSWDPFSLVDEFVAEDVASKAAFLSNLTRGAVVTAYVAAVAVSMLPFPVGSIAADLVAEALEGRGIPPALAQARKILGYVAIGSLIATVTKVAAKAITYAVQYLIKHGSGILKVLTRASPYGLIKRALEWHYRKRHTVGACGCFVGSTLVWTINGLAPISQVRSGDWVLTQDEVTAEYSWRQVQTEVAVQNATLVEITLLDDRQCITVVETTDEHRFWVESAGWIPAQRLQVGDLVRTVRGSDRVQSVSFASRQETVYNLSIAGNANFYVSETGIWVHNDEQWCGFLLTKKTTPSDISDYLFNNSQALKSEFREEAEEKVRNMLLVKVNDAFNSGSITAAKRESLDKAVRDYTRVYLGNE